MKKLTTTVLTLFLVALLSSAALAYGPGWGRGPGRGPCYGDDIPLPAELNLSAEQTKKIQDLREAMLKEIKPLQDKQFSKRGDLRLLWLKSNPDPDKIAATLKEVRDLRNQIEDKMTSYRLQMYKVFTPEQQEKVRAFGFGRDRCLGPGRGPGPDAGHGPGYGRGMGPQGNW